MRFFASADMTCGAFNDTGILLLLLLHLTVFKKSKFWMVEKGYDLIFKYLDSQVVSDVEER